jgi:ribose transport system permease protein
MTQLRVDSYVREIFVGLIVLAAVAVASLSKRRIAK